MKNEICQADGPSKLKPAWEGSLFQSGKGQIPSQEWLCTVPFPW